MTMLPRLFVPIILTLCSLLPPLAHAKLLGVSVSPKQGIADVAQGQSFAVRWRVSTTPSHDGGAFSPQGQIIDPVTSAVLLAVNNPLSRSEGAGPFNFEETLALTPAQLQEWQTKGITALRYQRSFSSASREALVVTGDLMIQLSGHGEANVPRSPSAGLFVHRLTMRFENARNRRSFSAGSSLRARVDLHYSGTGLLQGEWQIAREQSGQKSPFKPLVSVRKQLPLSRREYLVSPELPTTEPGQYRVRFCVIPLVVTPDRLTLDSQCPEPELISELVYQVGADHLRNLVAIELVTSRAITLTPTTALQWKPINGVAVYQLQIYKSGATAEVEGADFVLRMVRGPDQTRLHLSDGARQQLQPGQQYRWRITAHDEDAKMIGSSALAEFTYLP
jgi:hypothetical protein